MDGQSCKLCLLVKRDFRTGDEEGIKMKEQAILNLGNMLSKHGKAEGMKSTFVLFFLQNECDN